MDVSVASCEDYKIETCRRALEEALAPLGGLDWVRPGMKVAIKVNLIAPMKPETAAATHPGMVFALSELLSERGAVVIVGDSPGGLYTASYVGHAYSVAGYGAIEEHGGTLNQDFSQRVMTYPEGKVCRSFPFTAWLDGVDEIIDLCKLKTHGMMAMSGAAKNMFGIIPGTKKPEYHFQFSNPADFARMLIDLDECVPPRLSICDAVVAMEGNGPTAGTPRHMGFIAASENPHRLDLLCAAIIGLERSEVPTLEAAWERGLIPATAEELETAGDWRRYITPDYHRIEAQSSLLFRGHEGPIGRLTGFVVQKAICPRPKLERENCVGCGKCRDVCPAQAIVMRNGRPKISKSKCIHCFCCQELCPKGAMVQHRTAVARLLIR